MKRTYIKPIVKMVIIDHEQLLAGSLGSDAKGTTPEIPGIEPFGIDNTGSIDNTGLND